ncbi:MAG: hemolysin III family protein [Firmicutes bacterium]|nr:hemolysin III family protein [Bacillota bacterium]
MKKGNTAAVEAAGRKYHVKEPGSALTHFAALLLSVGFAPPLLVHGASRHLEAAGMAGLAVFMTSMVLLYGASSAYHTFYLSDRGNQVLKRLDHMMIFVLIAGTYTPVCLIHLAGPAGNRLMVLTWTIAAVGMLFKFFWVGCPKWVSSVLYIGMGWICILAWPQIVARVPSVGFRWLLAGGIIYTSGGVIYALKLPFPKAWERWFGTHELFHLFVIAGSFCHYMAMYLSI